MRPRSIELQCAGNIHPGHAATLGLLRNGNILIAVHTDNGDAEKRAKQVFEANSAHDVAVTGDASVPKKSEQVPRF